MTTFSDLSDPLNQLFTQFILFLPSLILALVLFGLTFVAASLLAQAVRRTMTNRNADKELTQLFATLTRWGLITLGTIVALQQINFNVTAFLTSLGIIGFTIGFAIQDVSKNFMAGILLLLQEPFKIGDAITVAGYTGTVRTVNLRATMLRTVEGTDVIIPNADVYTSAIVNFGPTIRRLDLTVGVAYGSDLDLVALTSVQAIADLPGLLADPAPKAVFNNFGDSSIDFTLYYWVDTKQTGVLDAKDWGVRALKVAFERAGIEIPFPVRTLLTVGPKGG
ncbi:MAG: mechanosensitive ion channel [Caldilineaceae bacterium]|nr:mechanosensitive ion channel [Caldilineaceae bacterium]MBP8107952.1 mechanosensitive ion channel [Caldilineaceae bacterium]MBP8122980.1 mechanosensitive ion channel [Caldilineaceae bacterium]MBP9073025.1 mechanosensitive ion channel [Caldilineaceae bacterium]